MADFPIGYPVLGALTGAAWVLADDGSEQAATAGASIGFLVGLGMGVLKASTTTSSSTTASAVGRTPARRGPPPSRKR